MRHPTGPFDVIASGQRTAAGGREPGPDAWRQVGRDLGRQRNSARSSSSRLMWDVGDWLRAGEDTVFRNLNRYKVRELAAELTGYSRHTLTMAASVARKVDETRRVDGLSWWHHLAVAHLTAELQSAWLTRAAELDWSVKTLRAQLTSTGPSARRPRRNASARAARLVREVLNLRRDQVPDTLVAQISHWLETGTARDGPGA